MITLDTIATPPCATDGAAEQLARAEARIEELSAEVASLRLMLQAKMEAAADAVTVFDSISGDLSRESQLAMGKALLRIMNGGAS